MAAESAGVCGSETAETIARFVGKCFRAHSFVCRSLSRGKGRNTNYYWGGALGSRRGGIRRSSRNRSERLFAENDVSADSIDYLMACRPPFPARAAARGEAP